MLAPVMIFFYFGLAEFCQGYMAQKRASHSAASPSPTQTRSPTP